MEKEGKCCFCGKQFNNYGNDIRPLVSRRGDRCCNDCNAEIVIPNRLKFWTNDYFYVIYDTESKMYIGELNIPCELVQARKTKTLQFAEIMVRDHPNWVIKRMLIREDN